LYFCNKIKSPFKFHLSCLSLSLFFVFLYMLLIWLETVPKWNITLLLFFCVDDADTKNKKMNNANTEKLKGTLKKNENNISINLVSEPSSDINWCEAHDHVVTPPTIKIEIWSRKAKIGLIGVWHNKNLPQGTNTIGMSRMTPRSQLIFVKWNSVCSRTEECKNHSHKLKLKNSEVIIIKGCRNFCYMSFNSSWKFNPNGPLMWTYIRPTQNWPKTLNRKAHNLIQTHLGS
jgi:hypothetical protein